MATSVASLRPRRSAWTSQVVPLLLPVLGAMAVGGLVTVKATYAFAIVVATGLILLVASNVYALPVFLILAMFSESLALGSGASIGRLAGVMAMAVISYHILIRGWGGLRLTPLLAAAAATGLWICVSVFWAHLASFLAQNFLRWMLAAAYMLTFAILIRTRAHVRTTLVTLALGSLVFGLYSFYSYLTQGATYLDQGLGATGGAADHNYFAVYQVMALPAGLALTVLDRKPGRRVLWYAVVVVIALSVVASLSRTGLIALVGAVVVTLLLPWRIFFRRPGQKLSYALALVGAVAVVGLSGSSPFVQRAQTIFSSSTSAGGSGSGRIDLWHAAWIGYKQHPWLGLGAGNFPAQSVELLQETPGANTAAIYARRGFVVHNMYLETLTELGPVGELILVSLLSLTGWGFITAFRRARRRGDRELEIVSIALLVSLLSYCLAGVFLSIQANKPLWILIGLALALDVMTRAPLPAEEPSPVRRAAPLAGLPPSRLYHATVDERQLEERERKVADQLQALVAEEERLRRLRELLSLRERKLETNERAASTNAVPASDTAVPAGDTVTDRRAGLVAERERALAKRAAELELRERAIAAREAKLEEAARAAPKASAPNADALASRERALASLERRLHERAESLAQRERELDARAQVIESRPLPAPVAAAPAVAEPAPQGFTEVGLDELERLVHANQEAHPDDAVTWTYTLFYLREHADVDGRLPSSFDVLIDDVFGSLLGR